METGRERSRRGASTHVNDAPEPSVAEQPVVPELQQVQLCAAQGGQARGTRQLGGGAPRRLPAAGARKEETLSALTRGPVQGGAGAGALGRTPHSAAPRGSEKMFQS